VRERHSQEVKAQSPPPPTAHANVVREISKTTRFYVPAVSTSSAHPQLAKTMTDPGEEMSLAHKLYIPKVFSSR